MQPTDNSHLTEEQRTEAYRHAHMAHVERQTKALEKINGTLNFFLFMFILGLVLAVIVMVSSNV